MRKLDLPDTVAAGTYYVEVVGVEDATAVAVQAVHDATVVATIAFLATNVLGLARDAAAGWASISAIAADVTIAGGSAGAPLRQIAGVAAGRVQAVVTVSTGGALSLYAHTKAG